MKKGKAYIEEGNFVYDYEEEGMLFVYDPQWDEAYLYDEDGNETSVTMFIPKNPTYSDLVESAKDFFKVLKSGIIHRL